MSINVAIVIPAYREALYIEKTLRSIEKSLAYAQGVTTTPMVVVVVNNPKHISQSFIDENQRLVAFLIDSKPLYQFDLHVLDYTDPGLQHGVGQARKIGIEYALAKHLHDPADRIICLDADSTVSLDYVFNLYQPLDIQAGFTIDCQHPTNKKSMIYYELFLRYVPHGLRRAKSPFDFTAIGSSMGCTAESYRKIGGMPVKSATEDFHFLNKLRKLAPVHVMPNTTVFASDRKSFRVSLGTGAFLQSTGKGFEKALQKLIIPSPAEFKRLQKVIAHIQDFYVEDSLLTLFEQSEDLLSFEHLRDRGIVKKLHKIKEGCKDMPTYYKRTMEVFDGLETIRILRHFSQERDPVTPDVFLSWCNEMLTAEHTNALSVLEAYRKTAK